MISIRKIHCSALPNPKEGKILTEIVIITITNGHKYIWGGRGAPVPMHIKTIQKDNEDYSAQLTIYCNVALFYCTEVGTLELWTWNVRTNYRRVKLSRNIRQCSESS